MSVWFNLIDLLLNNFIKGIDIELSIILMIKQGRFCKEKLSLLTT